MSDEPVVRYRLTGAVVLIVLAVIFLPWLFDGAGHPYMSGAEDPVPDAPEFAEPDLPLPSERRARLRDEIPQDEVETAETDDAGIDVDTEDAHPAAPEEAPQPLPAESGPTADVTSGWAVQVGSYRDGDNARDQERALRDEGIDAFVEDRDVDGETIYRVKVGPRADRDEALSLRDRLEEEHDLSGIVVTFP